MPTNLNPTRIADVPKVVADDNVYRLTDLIEASFKLPADDKDFDLTHEQLIKCCKILLFKFNMHNKKSAYERYELTTMINERID